MVSLSHKIINAGESVFEALALPFGIYFIWYGITQAKGVNRYIFIIFGAGNIVVDGYLLVRNILLGGVI